MATPELSLRLRRRSSQGSALSVASDVSSTWSQTPADWKKHAETLEHQDEHLTAEDCIRPSCSTSQSILLRLPPEVIIHHLLPQLNYPSLLSLRLCHPYFYHSPLLYPARASAIRMRVAWLVDCGIRGHPLVPTKSGGRLEVGTDKHFLENPQVQQLLRGEIQHADCENGEAGCHLVLGVNCGGPRKKGRLAWITRKRSERAFTSDYIWMICSALVAIISVVLYKFDYLRLLASSIQ